ATGRPGLPHLHGQGGHTDRSSPGRRLTVAPSYFRHDRHGTPYVATVCRGRWSAGARLPVFPGLYRQLRAARACFASAHRYRQEGTGPALPADPRYLRARPSQPALLAEQTSLNAKASLVPVATSAETLALTRPRLDWSAAEGTAARRHCGSRYYTPGVHDV